MKCLGEAGSREDGKTFYNFQHLSSESSGIPMIWQQIPQKPYVSRPTVLVLRYNCINGNSPFRYSCTQIKQYIHAIDEPVSPSSIRCCWYWYGWMSILFDHTVYWNSELSSCWHSIAISYIVCVCVYVHMLAENEFFFGQKWLNYVITHLDETGKPLCTYMRFENCVFLRFIFFGFYVTMIFSIFIVLSSSLFYLVRDGSMAIDLQ